MGAVESCRIHPFGRAELSEVRLFHLGPAPRHTMRLRLTSMSLMAAAGPRALPQSMELLDAHSHLHLGGAGECAIVAGASPATEVALMSTVPGDWDEVGGSWSRSWS